MEEEDLQDSSSESDDVVDDKADDTCSALEKNILNVLRNLPSITVEGAFNAMVDNGNLWLQNRLRQIPEFVDATDDNLHGFVKNFNKIIQHTIDSLSNSHFAMQYGLSFAIHRLYDFLIFVAGENGFKSFIDVHFFTGGFFMSKLKDFYDHAILHFCQKSRLFVEQLWLGLTAFELLQHIPTDDCLLKLLVGNEDNLNVLYKLQNYWKMMPMEHFIWPILPKDFYIIYMKNDTFKGDIKSIAIVALLMESGLACSDVSSIPMGSIEFKEGFGDEISMSLQYLTVVEDGVELRSCTLSRSQTTIDCIGFIIKFLEFKGVFEYEMSHVNFNYKIKKKYLQKNLFEEFSWENDLKHIFDPKNVLPFGSLSELSFPMGLIISKALQCLNTNLYLTKSDIENILSTFGTLNGRFKQFLNCASGQFWITRERLMKMRPDTFNSFDYHLHLFQAIENTGDFYPSEEDVEVVELFYSIRNKLKRYTEQQLLTACQNVIGSIKFKENTQSFNFEGDFCSDNCYQKVSLQKPWKRDEEIFCQKCSTCVGNCLQNLPVVQQLIQDNGLLVLLKRAFVLEKNTGDFATFCASNMSPSGSNNECLVKLFKSLLCENSNL